MNFETNDEKQVDHLKVTVLAWLEDKDGSSLWMGRDEIGMRYVMLSSVGKMHRERHKWLRPLCNSKLLDRHVWSFLLHKNLLPFSDP